MATDPFDGSGALSGSWTIDSGAVARSSGVARGNSTSDENRARWNTEHSSADFFAEANLLDGDSIGLMLRINSGATGQFYLAIALGDFIGVYRANNGSYTNLFNTSGGSFDDGDLVRFECEGTTLRVYINDVLSNSGTDSNYAGGAGSRYSGIRFEGNGSAGMDNWRTNLIGVGEGPDIDPENINVEVDGDEATVTHDSSPTPGVADYPLFLRYDDDTPPSEDPFDPGSDSPYETGETSTTHLLSDLASGFYAVQAFGRIPGGASTATVVATGAWVVSTGTSVAVTYPAGYSQTNDDMAVIEYYMKPYNGTTPSINQSWNHLAGGADGTTANGNGTGSVLGGGAYKLLNGGAQTNPTLTFGRTASPMQARMVIYRKTNPAASWGTPTITFGGDTSAGTGFSAAMAASLTPAVGSVLHFGVGIRDEQTFSARPTITQSGLTLGTVNRIGSASSTTSGNDGSADSAYVAVLSGTASGNATVAATLGTSETGVAIVICIPVSGTDADSYTDGSEVASFEIEASEEPQIVALNPATETDTARPFGKKKIRLLGIAAETDVAMPITRGAQIIAVGTATETDTALPIVAKKSRALGVAQETDLASAPPSGGSADLPAGAFARWKAHDLLSTLSPDDPVASWVDTVGSLAMEQSSSGSRPVLKANVLNGKAGVLFDGSNDYLTGAALDVGDEEGRYWVGAVIKKVSGPADTVFYNGLNNGWGLRTDCDSFVTWLQPNVSGGATLIQDFDQANPMAVIGTNDNDGADIYVNGATTSGGSSSGDDSGPTTSMLFGARNEGTPDDFWPGYILELVFFAREPTSQDIEDFWTYVQAEYGMDLGFPSEPSDPGFGITVHKQRALGVAEETDEALPITRGAHYIAVDTATETDEAQPIVAKKVLSVGAATEADAAQPITATKIRAVGIATEADEAQPITATKIRALGIATETDTAQSIGHYKRRALGVATETDNALAIGHYKKRAIGIASEVDEARPITAARTYPISPAEETDEALPINAKKSVSVGIATETDTAQAIGHYKVRLLGVAEELDAAVSLQGRKVGVLGPATESDAAQPFTAAHRAFLGTATEQDEAQPLGHYKIGHLRPAEETDTAQPITGTKRQAVGIASEVDEALSITARRVYVVGTATETDEARPITAHKVRVVGVANETEEALSIGHRKTRAIGVATEDDSAQPITASKRIVIGIAEELDEALPIQVGSTHLLGVALETDTALPILAKKQKVIGVAEETDSAQAIGHRKQRTVGVADETDSALPIGHYKVRSIGVAEEVDEARPITRGAKIIEVGTATETDEARPVGHYKVRQIGVATEVDEARPITRGAVVVQIGTATEEDEALPIVASKRRLLGIAEETDTALPIGTPGKIVVVVGTAVETDEARSITPIKRRAVNYATETDAAQPIRAAKARLVGTVLETDYAGTIGPVKKKLIGVALETDVALRISPYPRRNIIITSGTPQLAWSAETPQILRYHAETIGVVGTSSGTPQATDYGTEGLATAWDSELSLEPT